MVAFPDSGTEPVSLDITDLNQNDYRNYNEKPANDIDARKVKDQAFTIARVTMADNKDSYPLKFDGIDRIDDKKIKSSTDSISAEPALVKKIAAGLKASLSRKDRKDKKDNKDKKDKKEMSGGDTGGDGSLSSGSSIITISSVSNSDPDPDCHHNSHGSGRDIREERWYHTVMQVSIPFFIAGIGTIGAGLVLNEVKRWPAFKAISQLLILVPSLLGLKGNLDMCLASRLCTQANLGNMQGYREIVKMIIGNIALVQIQAIIAAIFVSLFAMTVGAITAGPDEDPFVWNHALLLATASMCTATSSCFILDLIMIAVIMVSHRCNMNPDNLATPLAASFGDVVSISLLAAVASQLFLRLNAEIWVLYTILAFYLLILPFWILIVLKNKYTKSVLTSGWIPVLSALFISGFGGLILDRVVDVYHGFVIFQPIINGIGGNLVSVQASRISTMLHQSSIMGILPPHAKMWVTPCAALFKGSPYAKTARILISMAIPGQLVFVFVADYLNRDNCMLHAYFVLSYIGVSVLQVMFLLYIAHIIIHAMWRYKIDPDNSAIPYLTALGDLSGSLFLALAFWFIYEIKQEYCVGD